MLPLFAPGEKFFCLIFKKILIKDKSLGLKGFFIQVFRPASGRTWICYLLVWVIAPFFRQTSPIKKNRPGNGQLLL